MKKSRLEKKENAGIMNVLFVLFIIYGATLLLPLVWMLINSFKPDNNEFFYDQWKFTSFTLENYKLLFTGENNILGMLANTLILSLTIPTVSAFFSLCAAHAVASFQYKLRNVVYFIFIMPMFVSVAGTTPYVYKLLNDLGLFDKHIGLIIMSCGVSGFGFLMYYSVFRNISHTYVEAAMIDGAGYWRTFLQILVPQAKNMVVAQWVMGFIGTWNDFSGPYLFMPSHPTLGVGVKEISDKIDLGHSYPELFATIIIMLIPIIILFFAFQKKIMTVSLGGGIKG
ncbi:MAG: carbohydrate ABC transporter permease [Lachnospiraceae bacterium]|nr:carbohydrate ABC transporter permease [Lachnospiraceae bacterium]